MTIPTQPILANLAFFDYINLSSDEVADRIMDKLRQSEQASNETIF